MLSDLERCRTPALGGHRYRCAQCGGEAVLSNSCLNRHCPTCQGPAQFTWVAQRTHRLLATPYFHLVFTLPAALRPLALCSPRLLFTLLFAAAAHTLLDLARDPKRLGATMGFSLVLHTWKCDLQFHPHVHCVVPAGGLRPDGLRWCQPPSPEFFLPQQRLAARFRTRLRAALLQEPETASLPASVWPQKWVVDVPPAGSGQTALKYLAA